MSLEKLEKWVEPFVWELQKSRQTIPLEGEGNLERVALNWGQRIKQGQFQSSKIVRSVWRYVVIGIAVGAGIHGYVSTDFITQCAGANNLFAVAIAVILGVPLYANIADVMPITEALVN